MFPLLRRYYSIVCKIHSYSPSTITYNSRIMIILLIWYLLLIIGLMHCFCKIPSLFSFWWIFILFILPLFWNLYTIIPKIITNCIIIKIFSIWIIVILFIWNNTIYSLYHSISLTIFITKSPFFRYFYIILV